MKKKILAIVVVPLLASGSAWAQANLTLYGNIDASVVSASGIAAGDNRRTSCGEGNWAPSVWGVQGTEDLGGGMRGLFHLEGGYNAGNGTIANGGTTGIFSRLAALLGPYVRRQRHRATQIKVRARLRPAADRKVVTTHVMAL